MESLEQMQEAHARGMGPAVFARVIPDAPAILSETGNRSFRELNARCNQLVRVLRAAGLTPGDRVALVCGNRPEFVEVIYACLRSGFYYTPINWHLTVDEAAYIVRDSGAKALVAEQDFAPLMLAVSRVAPAVTCVLAVGAEVPGTTSYAAALSAESGEDIVDPELGGRMLYTSGTTGKPKGVLRPKTYLAMQTPVLSAAGYAHGQQQLHLCTGPLYHAAPLTFSLLLPLNEGVGVVLMARWDAERALALIEEHRVSQTHMVPTMFHRLLRLPEDVKRRYDISSLKYVIHGAAPCPVATKKAMIDWLGPIVWEYYAATEGAGTAVGSEEWLQKAGTVGKPVTADHVRILDDAGARCPANQPGTVYLKMLAGAEFTYHGDADKTKAAMRGEHFTLGDVGYLDDDGYLFLTDRSAHLIISGGVNIYPAEVEAALLQHPSVQDVAVIGVPNEEWGEEVRAIVELAAETRGDAELEAAIIAFCRERIAHFKCPRRVEFVERLPRHDNGKLYKQRLREHYRK